MSLKVIQTGTIRKLGCSLCAVSYSPSIVTMAVSLFMRYAASRHSVTLKTVLGVTEDH